MNLGFSLKNLSKEEIDLFQGGGKTMKHIAISSIQNIDDDRIRGLLELVHMKH